MTSSHSEGKKAGTCCLKTAVLPGPVQKPACTTCGGYFYKMGGSRVPMPAKTGFDNWNLPVIVERGSRDHQLYSQITFRPVETNKQTPVATENLLEDTDGLRRPPFF